MLRAGARSHRDRSRRPCAPRRGLLPVLDPLAMAELLTAVDRGDASALQPLLESRADPEACGSDGRSALVCACLANNLPVAKLLITYQAAVDTAIADGETALRAACVEGSADCVQLLLERGGARRVAAAGAPRPLHDATRNGHVACARLLLRASASATAPCAADRATPLLLAVRAPRDACALVSELLAARAAAGEAAPGGALPLVCASGAAHAEAAEVVRLLLRARAARRAVGGGRRRGGRPPLGPRRALRLRKPEVVRELLAYGSAAAAEETRGLWPDGVPPSEYAHSRDDIRSVELLEAAESREVAKFVGRRVELSGLKEKPQLNRRRGTVRHFVWDGRLDTGRESPPSQVPRFAVSIDGEAADVLHPLQKQNLVLLADAEQVDAAAPAGGTTGGPRRPPAPRRRRSRSACLSSRRRRRTRRRLATRRRRRDGAKSCSRPAAAGRSRWCARCSAEHRRAGSAIRGWMRSASCSPRRRPRRRDAPAAAVGGRGRRLRPCGREHRRCRQLNTNGVLSPRGHRRRAARGLHRAHVRVLPRPRGGGSGVALVRSGPQRHRRRRRRDRKGHRPRSRRRRRRGVHCGDRSGGGFRRVAAGGASCHHRRPQRSR